MKIKDLINNLQEIENNNGNIDVIYSQINNGKENYCYLESKDLFIVIDKKVDNTKSLVINPFLLSIDKYKGYNNIV